MKELPKLEELSPTDFSRKIQEDAFVVLDTRSYLAYGSQHIPGSWHLDLNGNFPTFAGWVIPTDKKILLVADSFSKAQEAVIWARRTGVDHIVGYLDGSMTAWAISGLRSSSVQQISAEDLHDRVVGHDQFIMLDVRAPGEFKDSHIEGAINIPVADLRTRFNELDPEKKTVLACSSGNRSSLGTSILKQKGFKNIINLAGGMTGYSAAGHAAQCRVCVNPHGSRFHNA